jgi:flagellar assembly factor FliW
VKFDTTRFGTIDVPEERMITMSRGVLGFPEKRRFCIIQHKKNTPFFWYQSVDDPALAFVITNPWLFKPDYEVDLDLAAQALGREKNAEDVPVECYVIVTIPKGSPEKMTGNFIAPLVLDPKRREAVQIVLSDDSYSHRYPLVKKKAA